MKLRYGFILTIVFVLVFTNTFPCYNAYSKENISKEEKNIVLLNERNKTYYNSTENISREKEVKVMIDEDFINYNNDYGYPFLDENNRAQVPLRLTLEYFGAEVFWDPQEFEAVVVKGDTIVQIPIGKDYIIVNGELTKNDTKSVIYDDRTFMPIRIVLEAFGAEVLWNKDNYHVIINSIPTRDSLVKLPKKYDNRNNNRVTSVKNQGNLGTCWAFATFGALESSLMPDEYRDFSEDHLTMQHGFDLNQNQGGEFTMSLAYLTRWSGPVEEKKDIYGDGVSPTGLNVEKHLQEAIIIPEKNNNEIKKAVYRFGGVQTSVYSPIIDNRDDSIYYNKETNSLYHYGNNNSNHDVVIVGWDDNYPKENFLKQPEGDGAFICKNSWGEDFGEDGYYYVSYYDENIGIKNIAYTRIDPVDNYDNIYQTDLLGWIGNLGYDDETAFFSNVYKANNKEKLKAVSFYATGENSIYELYYVENFKDINSLKERDLLTKGRLKYKGYFTIDIDEEIVLEKGNEYAVIVKITTPGAAYPVAIEFDGGNYTSDVIIDDGKGYISYDGDYWQSTELEQDSNVSLKVFTDNY